jgi:hypothetical protein
LSLNTDGQLADETKQAGLADHQRRL